MHLQSLRRSAEKQAVAYFTIKRLLLSMFYMYAGMLISCSNKIHISEYSKYTRIDHNWFQTFINDSLKFSIDFFGRNNYMPFGSNAKYVVSESNIAILKSLGIRRKAKILLYLKPGITRYGQATYGYLVDKKNLVIDTSLATFSKTKKGDDFFVLKQRFKKDDEESFVAGTAIKNKYFLLIESQKEAASEDFDSTWQLINTKFQIASLLKGEYIINFLATRKKIINAIDSISSVPNYLGAINGLRAMQEDTIDHYKADMYYFQDVVTRISYFDDLDSIHQVYDSYRSPETTVNPNNKFAIDGDALQKVTEIAKSQKMLMINESHYDFRHRLFVYLMLDSLYKNGYRNLCIEALSRRIDDSYIKKGDGSYIAEPFFATLIRRAKEIGFNVYNYDNSAPNIEDREYGQAKNLYDLYSKDPGHKWVVLAGYAHINKRYFMKNIPSALQHFTTLAGFAPYSINQSTLSDILNQKYTLPDSPVGYFAVDTSSFIYKDRQADLYIINNIKKHPFEAPFTSIKPYLKKYIIDIPQSINENIFIYIKKELDELHNSAIPVYISKAKKDNPATLRLPNNEYIGIIVNNNGQEVAKFNVISQDQ